MFVNYLIFSRFLIQWAFDFQSHYHSARAKSYPHSHWMAPGVASDVSEEEWNELYHEAVQEILACMPTTHSDAECMPKIERKTQGCNITYFGGSQSE